MFFIGFFGFLFFLALAILRPGWLRGLMLAFLGGLVLLIGPSRVYVGEHWPSDVLGAYLLGGIALWLAIRIYRSRRPRA
jgi:undecaprenyl-diphosphatase